jgi:hypothetical protein
MSDEGKDDDDQGSVYVVGVIWSGGDKGRKGSTEVSYR